MARKKIDEEALTPDEGVEALDLAPPAPASEEPPPPPPPPAAVPTRSERRAETSQAAAESAADGAAPLLPCFRVWEHGSVRHDGVLYAPGDVVPVSAEVAAAIGPAIVKSTR